VVAILRVREGIVLRPKCKHTSQLIGAPQDSNPEPTDYETGRGVLMKLDQLRCNRLYRIRSRQSCLHLATSEHVIAP
jgi:hypothetical protein